jgi:hypothetical protein
MAVNNPLEAGLPSSIKRVHLQDRSVVERLIQTGREPGFIRRDIGVLDRPPTITDSNQHEPTKLLPSERVIIDCVVPPSPDATLARRDRTIKLKLEEAARVREIISEIKAESRQESQVTSQTQGAEPSQYRIKRPLHNS